ncbi:MAG: hypothetical protein FWG20_05655 [Candidatus Cloacimonetes bacterium]|nr:hypothetical protein [Candidatus Cloacimonadota bacterium]
MDNLYGIKRASLDLLTQMGVSLSTIAKNELSGAATNSQINALESLARGITAQRSGTEVTALNYYFLASAYDPSLAEAVNRSNVISRDISSGSIGSNVQNAILWRRDWVAKLEETEKFLSDFFTNTPLLHTLLYSADVTQGNVNYQNETVDLDFHNFFFYPDMRWIEPIEKTLQAVYDGLQATKNAKEWGLSNWPMTSVSKFTNYQNITKKYDLAISLYNSKNIVIHRPTVSLSCNYYLWESKTNRFYYRIRSDYFKEEEEYPLVNKSFAFKNVPAFEITDNLRFEVTSINGTPVKDYKKGDLRIQAIPVNNFYKDDDVIAAKMTKSSQYFLANKIYIGYQSDSNLDWKSWDIKK